MARQVISKGATANDGTGDTLRAAADKINDNFGELYSKFSSDSLNLMSTIEFTDDRIVFEGSSADGNETHVGVINATADRYVYFPNASGTLITDSSTSTLINKTLTTPTIASITNGGTVTIPSGADTLAAIGATQTITNKTIVAPTLIHPKLGTNLQDSSGNEFLILSKAGSAVNEITLANAATGNNPSLTASGGDANVGINLSVKGKGSVKVDKIAFGVNTQTGNGQADSDSTYIICNKGSALAVALGPGTTVGETKIFTNKGAGAATITPAPFAQGSTIALAQYDGCTCIWDGTNWYLVGNQGEVTVA